MMKKIVVILLTLLIVSGVKAQTFEESQKRVDSETAKLEKRLGEVKDQIFYLKVTAPEQLQKTKSPVEKQKLKKEIFFAKEDTVRLISEKANLEKTLASLKETALTGTEQRTKADIASNLPEQMSPVEYRRRSRAQVFRLSEGGADNTNTAKKFGGLLINEKKNIGESTNFYIERVDIKDVPPVSLNLKPQEKKDWELPAGTYRVTVTCGNSVASDIFHVDPRVLNWFDGRKTYWAIKKNLSDW